MHSHTLKALGSISRTNRKYSKLKITNKLAYHCIKVKSSHSAAGLGLGNEGRLGSAESVLRDPSPGLRQAGGK